MIRVSVMYPNQTGVRFDWEYYMNKHIPAARELTNFGLVRIEVDKGIRTGQPGAPVPFVLWRGGNAYRKGACAKYANNFFSSDQALWLKGAR